MHKLSSQLLKLTYINPSRERLRDKVQRKKVLQVQFKIIKQDNRPNAALSIPRIGLLISVRLMQLLLKAWVTVV
jgi:hypothetical protein